MMQGTLQDMALLSTTANIPSLKGLFAFCDGNPRIGDACDRSPFFWRESLMRIFGKTLVLQRGDLNDGDWRTFAKILATGKIFEYAMRADTNLGVYSGPEPYYNIAENEKTAPDDVYYSMFKIPVAVPLSGTQGYFVRWRFDGAHNLEVTSFFVGPDTAQVLKLASEWIAIEYRKYHMKTLFIAERNGEKVDFFRDEDYHGDQGIRQVMPNETVLTKLVLDNLLSPSGTKGDLWFSYYGSFDKNHPYNSRYSESNYVIVPTTF